MDIVFTVDAGQVADYIESKGERIVAALRDELKAQTEELLTYIKDDKLSGQVLNQRSGRLKNSAVTVYSETETQMADRVSLGGDNVRYAAIHEFGGTINVPEVTDKLMVFERDGQTIFTMRHRAFTVNMPARPYANPALEEKSPDILSGLQGAINEVLAS